MTQVDEPLNGVTWNMDYCFMGDNLEDDLLDNETDEKKRGNPSWWCMMIARRHSGHCW